MEGKGGEEGGTGWRLEFTFQPYRPATPLPGQQQTQVQVLLCPTWTGEVSRLLTLADQSKALVGCESQRASGESLGGASVEEPPLPPDGATFQLTKLLMWSLEAGGFELEPAGGSGTLPARGQKQGPTR